MMPAEITAGIKSGRLKELTLTQAERYSRNEQMLQLMREGRLNIKAYWDKEQRKVVFGMVEEKIIKNRDSQKKERKNYEVLIMNPYVITFETEEEEKRTKSS